MTKGEQWVEVWHAGRKLRGDKFSLSFLKSGEGTGLLGPGVYFASSRYLAERYAKYHADPWIYRCRIDVSRVLTVRGEPAHLLARHRRAEAAEEDATGSPLVYPWDSLVYGRGLVGYFHKKYGAKQAAERMISAGIIGYSELLPSDVTEYCVWDIDAIEVVEALPCKPASKNPLAQSGNRARMISGGVGMKKLVSGGGWRKRVPTDKTEKPFVAYHLDKDGKQCWYACDTLLEARSVAARGPSKQATCKCEQVGHYTTTCKMHGTPALKPVPNPGGKKQRREGSRDWPEYTGLRSDEHLRDAAAQRRAVAAEGPLWRMGNYDYPAFSGGVRAAEASVRKARAARLHEESVGIGVKALPNPGGKKGFAVVQHKGMEEVVLSVHSAQAAAQSAMRVKEGKSGRMDLRVQAFGPGTGRELVTGMDGGRFLRHTLARNPAKRPAPRSPAAVAAGKRVLGLKVGDIVCYKASHLKSLHWFTNVPINGKITKLEGDKHAHLYPDRVGEDLSAAYIATVKWHDRTPSRVLCSNLIKYTERHRELP